MQPPLLIRWPARPPARPPWRGWRVVVLVILVAVHGAVRGRHPASACCWDASQVSTPAVPTCPPPTYMHVRLSVAGHRNLKPTSLPLRRGMLAYAHSRKLPVQVGRACVGIHVWSHLCVWGGCGRGGVVLGGEGG